MPSLADLLALPERAVRRHCQVCGWDWIARLPECPRCAEDRVLALPMRRIGWVPSEAGPDQLELYGWDGRYLGAVAYRRAAWAAFTPAGPTGEHPLLRPAQQLLEAAVRYQRPEPIAARWQLVSPPPRGRLDLLDNRQELLGAVVLRTGRWWCLLGDAQLLVAERPSEAEARRWLVELLGVRIETGDATSA